jgi:hypothetical protein
MPVIGLLTFELRVEHSHSLKEKRNLVKSLKDRLHSKHNVAVAEIDFQDLWQRALLAAVTISSDRLQASQVLDAVERDVASSAGEYLTSTSREWID